MTDWCPNDNRIKRATRNERVWDAYIIALRNVNTARRVHTEAERRYAEAKTAVQELGDKAPCLP